MEKFDWYTIRPSKYGGFDVHGFGTYPRSSVLAGQTRKVFLDAFETEEEALRKYPEATPGGDFTDPQVSLTHLPDDGDDDFIYEEN